MNELKDVMIAFISAIGGGLTGYFTFRGKKVETESIYTSEVRAIIQDYKEEKAELQKEKAELLDIVERVKRTNSELEKENFVLKDENKCLELKVKELDRKKFSN